MEPNEIMKAAHQRYAFHIHKADHPMWFFTFAYQGVVILQSRAYASKQGCKRAIGKFKELGKDAPVFDET